MKPGREEFDAWRSGPIAEFFFNTFLAGEMARTKQNFQDQAWEGHGDEIALATHRERYETLEWLCGLDMAEIEATLEKQE
jgi:hypothetical protein